MKSGLAVFLIFLVTPANVLQRTPSLELQAQGQPQTNLNALIATDCRGDVLPLSDTHREKVREAVLRLAPILKTQYPNERVLIATVTGNTINAWTIPAPGISLVCFPSGMIDFLGSDSDEIAFILAHEYGHAIDEACKQAKLTDRSMRLKQECETRADRIGFDMLIKAGYSPFAAAGAFGRLEMYAGDTQGGFLARFLNLSKDHPITPDRIRNLRNMLIEYERVARGPLG